jgi:hypothetical protein
MADEEILKKFEEQGGRIKLVDLRKYFSNEELKRISELIDANVLKTEISGSNVFIVYEKPPEQNQTQTEQIQPNVNEIRKEIILEEIRKRFEPKLATITEIFQSILDADVLKQGEERQKFLDTLWFTIPIENVEIILIADKLQYKIKIANEEIILEENEIFSPEAFVRKFFKVFGFVLPKPSRKAYGLWLAYIRAIGVENIKLKTLETDEELIRNVVVNYIENSYLSENVEDLLLPNTVYLDRGYVAVPNNIIKKIVELRLEKKVTYKQIANAVRDILEFSRPVKIKGELIRMWYFKKENFNFQKPILEKEEEENENNNSGETRNGEDNLAPQQNSGNQ